MPSFHDALPWKPRLVPWSWEQRAINSICCDQAVCSAGSVLVQESLAWGGASAPSPARPFPAQVAQLPPRPWVWNPAPCSWSHHPECIYTGNRDTACAPFLVEGALRGDAGCRVHAKRSDNAKFNPEAQNIDTCLRRGS